MATEGEPMDGAYAVTGSGAPARATRTASPAWLAGPLSVGLGLAAHLAAGGQAPGIPILAALAALAGMAASITGRRPLPLWGILLAAALAQQLLHLAFAAFSTSSGFALPGHGHGETAYQDPTSQGTPRQETAAHSLHLMLHLHAAAALVVMILATQWSKAVSLLQRGSKDSKHSEPSGVERAPGDTDA